MAEASSGFGIKKPTQQTFCGAGEHIWTLADDASCSVPDRRSEDVHGGNAASYRARTSDQKYRVSLFAVFVVATCSFPQKGSQSTGQGGSSGGNAAANYASYQGGVPSFAAAPYSAVGGAYGYPSVTTFVQGPGYQPLVAGPVVSDSGSQLAVGVQAAGAAQLGQAAGSLSSLPAYVVPQMYVSAGDYNAGTQEGLPDTQWSVPTTVFQAGSADLQSLGDVLPPAAPASSGAILTSGETASISKEAEQGNYQRETEEFGYPADLSGYGPGFGQGLATVLVPGAQLGGFRPVSAGGKYDLMLMYGLYPPGSYASFSQNHEAGKDYSQAIHYLREHVAESHGSGQQKKFF